MRRRSFVGILSAAMMGRPQTQDAGRDVAIPNRPRVPGALSLRARRRGEQAPGSGRIRVSERALRWDVAQTAIMCATCGTLTRAACRRNGWPPWRRA